MPDKHIEVRPIEQWDIAPLAESFRPQQFLRRLESRFAASQENYRAMYVGLLDGVPVGSVSTGGTKQIRPDCLHLFALDVAPQYQNRGVGTALIRAIESEAVRMGFPKVNLEVGFTNAGARRLYERLGYRRDGPAAWDGWTAYRADDTPVQEGEWVWPMVKYLQSNS